MLQEVDLVYPVTAVFVGLGAETVHMNFETVEEWQAHIQSAVSCAEFTLDQDIVPCDEDKKHCDMFNAFEIDFNIEQTGRLYGRVVSQMRMPVPVRTMLQ